jgi:hypothetical protein
MRHNFVNDIGDYAKYALLRALCAYARDDARLGVLWYLTEHQETNGDGRRRPHLSGDGWDSLDPELLQLMRGLETSIGRKQSELRLELVERSGFLPPGTLFFSEPVPHDGTTARERTEQRIAWFARAQTTLAESDLLFLDPDNGLEVKSIRLGSRLAGKYAMLAEVHALLTTGASVILYQHADRSPWPIQRARVCAQIRSAAGPAATIRTMRFGAFGGRAFFCISTDLNLAEGVDRALDVLAARVAGWDRAHHLLIE